MTVQKPVNKSAQIVFNYEIKNDEFFAHLLALWEHLPQMKKMRNQHMPKFEQRVGMTICQYMEFQTWPPPLRQRELENKGRLYIKYSEKPEEHGLGADSIYIGEWLEHLNKPHGRGIYIQLASAKISYDVISILYFDEGYTTMHGNFVMIYDNSSFRVGNRYKENGAMKTKGTNYDSDGSISKFDTW